MGTIHPDSPGGQGRRGAGLLTRRRPGRMRSSGATLVIVLAGLVLLTVLVLAFLASINTELRSAKVYSEGANARLLAQSAVNLAMAQISEAAKGVDSDGNVLAWASQPGMIRTYGANGRPAGYYRLYSWTDMTGTGGFDPALATNSVPASWPAETAVFTDLNQPILLPSASGTAQPVYPIVDGNNLSPMAAVGGNKTYGTNGVPAIEGFYVSTNAPVAAGAGSNPVPMPVKWLYVLADGRIVVPAPEPGGKQVRVTGATRENPIVGRMAFWADDETGKVNINTASEGSFTDTPRLATPEELALGQNQPLQREYQRYPGHPATTSLSAVIKKPAGLTDQQWKEEIYRILPRVKEGGSEGGTIQTSNVDLPPLTPDSDRLYASTDEFVFKNVWSGTEREEAQPSVINRETLEQAKFFLTSSSRAPDLTLFNTPRVSIWPITLDKSDGNPLMTPFDKLIAFCGSMRNDLGTPYRYYFQRQDPNDPANDLPATAGLSGLGRNRMLLEYLRALTSRDIPGFGGSFSAKYPASNATGGTDRDQILTEIFDYIRASNLADSTISTSWPGQYAQAFVSASGSPSGLRLGGLGQVVPIEDETTGTRGFGRFPTLQQAFLVFIAVGNSGAGLTPAVGADKMRVQAGLFFQLFDPSQGVSVTYPWYSLAVRGADEFQWDGVSMGFPGGSQEITQPYTGHSGGKETFYGGVIGFRQLVFKKGVGGGGTQVYPLISGTTGTTGQAPDMPEGGTFDFSGGDVTVEIYANDAAGQRKGSPLQSITLNFPAATFPVPLLVSGTDAARFRNFTSHVGRLNYSPEGSIIRGEDVVRSVVATPGDVRLIAARKTISSGEAPGFFATLPDYSGSNRQSHNLRNGLGHPLYGARGGKLVNVPYPGYQSQHFRADMGAFPARSWDTDVPSQTGVAQTNGTPPDFDNGLSSLRDGPYINKADEGDRGFYSGNYTIPYYRLEYVGQGSLPGPTLFSPNRMLPSAAMFGSLPSGVWANAPWQTLLFRPGPDGHPGLGFPASGPPYVKPPDHLLLDLFSMPVVEPYAISEPLSTDGRINMNHQIVPFTYINRDTGLRAVLKSEKVLAISDTDASRYKTSGTSFSCPPSRFPIDLDATLKQFQTRRFDHKDIFRSASEICEIDLVPDDPALPAATRANPTRALMDAYWATHRLTGDNSRERPYANIYPRLTTKSNSFTVFYRAQSLQKRPGDDPERWDETKDRVTGEQRGSQTVERFIDPNDTGLPDYADAGATSPIGEFYKFRVILAKRFAP